MKRYLTLAAAFLILTGCATFSEPKFTFWDDHTALVGTGGLHKTFIINDYIEIEFWSDGAPISTHRIVGIIRQEGPSNNYMEILPNKRALFNKILKQAAAIEADGIYLLKRERFVSGYRHRIEMDEYDTAEADSEYTTGYLLALFKYL